MHAAVMRYLRYSVNLPLVCTEVGNWSADVMGASKTRLVEVEIKKSLSDLRAEFRRKRGKHSYYRTVGSPSAPKYFYFCLPESLIERAQPIIEEGFPQAGILSFREGAGTRGHISSYKKAQALHRHPPDERILSAMVMRMSSELASLRTSLDEVLALHYEQVQRSIDNHLDEMSLLYGVDLDSEVSEHFDCHPRVDSLAQRLAEAMDGISGDAWFEVAPKEQQRYRDAAMRLARNGREDFSEAIKK